MPVSCLTPYWTLAVLHASQLPDIVLNTGSLVCQSAAWHRTEHWLSYMSVSCLTPYWTLAVLHASQLPDTVLNTGSLVCQSAAWHRTEHQLSFMLVAWLCESTSASLHVSQLSDPLNEPLSPSMSVSCLTLWMNPGSVACQSVVWSSALTLDPLHVRQLPDPVTTLALLRVSQLSDPLNEPWIPCMSVSCLILCTDAGSLACQTVARSCDNPGSLACQTGVWPCEWTLFLSCISVTLPVTQYSEGCGQTRRDIWATKEKDKPKQRMTV